MDRKIVEMFLQGKTTRDVMRTLRIGDRRARRARYLAEEYGYLGKVPPIPLPPYPEAVFPEASDGRYIKTSEADTLLLTRKEWITERLDLGWHPITVYEELNLAVGRSSFYRFLQRHKISDVGTSARQRVVPEIIHRPGEALILDWGKLRDVVDPITQKKSALWAFVGVLGYSRYMMVRLVWTNETKVTLAAIESMFREIGGTTERVTSDNPKCFALEASRYEPLLNPAFERMAAHYQTRIECLPPADPEKKGKVERLMPYVRRLYESHGADWHGIEESQTFINRKCVLANDRVHGTTRLKPIAQLVDVEVQSLKPLPPLGYEVEESSEAKVRRDGHVRFDSKYYSLDEKFTGSTVLVLANATKVSIYHQGKLIEVHDRILSTDPLRSKSTKNHHLKPWERELENGSLYRKRALRLGPDVERFVIGLLELGQGFIDTRKIWGILSLDKSFTKPQINEACRQALEIGSLSYRTVRSLIQLLPKNPNTAESAASAADPLSQPNSSATLQADNKFVRPMSVYEEQLKLLLH